MESEEVAIEDDGAVIEEEAADDGGGLYGGAAAHNPAGFDASEDEEDRTRIGVMNIDGRSTSRPSGLRGHRRRGLEDRPT